MNENKLNFCFFLCTSGGLIIVRKEMFLLSGENCKKLFCMQWQKTFNCIFCLKQQQFWWHDFESISYHILFHVMLIYFLFNMFSNKKMQKNGHWSVSLYSSALYPEARLQLILKSKIIMSLNHRMAQVERDLKNHLVPIPRPWAGAFLTRSGVS